MAARVHLALLGAVLLAWAGPRAAAAAAAAGTSGRAAEARPCRCVRFTTDCSSRELSRVQAQLSVCPQATKLDLSNNAFRDIPDGLSVNLTEIDLSRNLINASTRALRGLSKLRVLDIKLNALDSFAFVPDTCMLRSLDVSVNEIAAIDSALWRCTQLETLDLSYNKIMTLNESGFSLLTRLRRLDLSGNLLNTLPNGAFLGLSQLTWLSLRACGMSRLPDGAFRGLGALHTLHMEQNTLQAPPSSAILAPMPQLQVLTLDHDPNAPRRAASSRRTARLQRRQLSRNARRHRD